jgi:hypothetical protein
LGEFKENFVDFPWTKSGSISRSEKRRGNGNLLLPNYKCVSVHNIQIHSYIQCK